MPVVKRTATTLEEVVEIVLKQIQSANPAAPETLADHVTKAGVTDPFLHQLAVRGVRAMLRPGSGHYQLTQQKLWAYEREQWAKEEGLAKGRTVAVYDPDAEATQNLRELAATGEYLSSDARGYALTMHGTLNRRAGRKLDASSVAVVADAAADMLHELEVQGRVIEEKDARIEQAERHNQQLRDTNDRLLSLMERLAPGGRGKGELALARSEYDDENGGARSPTN
jgi:hypothetical protein